MMKRVLAIGNDRVDMTGGIRINGKPLPASAPLKADKAGGVIKGVIRQVITF
ncbi:hypothetical protein [Nitrosospira sp. Nsp13]|uniref:hypothetical protein n=1 Tax=Nitrosospira sp. Nsp13 TaxID=1855332 RepID=UPI0020C8D453|nr:hypothetical protein [Nitrosospira sp. Nsp13]